MTHRKSIKEQYSKLGKTTTMSILAPCPKCSGWHKDIQFEPHTPKAEDRRLYTHVAVCPKNNGVIMADLTNDFR